MSNNFWIPYRRLVNSRVLFLHVEGVMQEMTRYKKYMFVLVSLIGSCCLHGLLALWPLKSLYFFPVAKNSFNIY